MNIEPSYRIEFAPEVHDFIRRLVKRDRAAVFHELHQVAARLVDPKIG
jgi:mRNA-degrading endonuclease RelE of RelBE toxin-antitoxin system